MAREIAVDRFRDLFGDGTGSTHDSPDSGHYRNSANTVMIYVEELFDSEDAGRLIFDPSDITDAVDNVRPIDVYEESGGSVSVTDDVYEVVFDGDQRVYLSDEYAEAAAEWVGIAADDLTDVLYIDASADGYWPVRVDGSVGDVADVVIMPRDSDADDDGTYVYDRGEAPEPPEPALDSESTDFDELCDSDEFERLEGFREEARIRAGLYDRGSEESFEVAEGVVLTVNLTPRADGGGFNELVSLTLDGEYMDFVPELQRGRDGDRYVSQYVEHVNNRVRRVTDLRYNTGYDEAASTDEQAVFTS